MRTSDAELPGPGVRGACLNLHNGDTDCKEEEGHPLCGRKSLPEEKHGEGCGGQDLHLVSDLERGDWKVADGDELE